MVLTKRPGWLKLGASPADATNNPDPARVLLDARPPFSFISGQLLVTAGNNPDRLHSEGALAALTGTCRVPASSGRTQRHRLNRGGDRHANAAIYRVVLCRMRWDPRTRDYVERRTKGRSLQERDHPLPQALPRPRALQRRTPHQPLDNR